MGYPRGSVVFRWPQEFLKTTPPQQYDHATAIEVPGLCVQIADWPVTCCHWKYGGHYCYHCRCSFPLLWLSPSSPSPPLSSSSSSPPSSPSLPFAIINHHFTTIITTTSTTTIIVTTSDRMQLPSSMAWLVDLAVATFSEQSMSYCARMTWNLENLLKVVSPDVLFMSEVMCVYSRDPSFKGRVYVDHERQCMLSDSPLGHPKNCKQDCEINHMKRNSITIWSRTIFQQGFTSRSTWRPPYNDCSPCQSRLRSWNPQHIMV